MYDAIIVWSKHACTSAVESVEICNNSIILPDMVFSVETPEDFHKMSFVLLNRADFVSSQNLRARSLTCRG